MKVIIALLVIWVVLAILGAVIKGLFWLLIIGVVLFLLTAVFGGIRQRRGRSSSS